MYVEAIIRKIITEMSNEMWTVDHNGFIVVPQSPDEVDKVLEFLAPYFDDVDESDASLYDGCDCDWDDDDCSGMQMTEPPKHDPSVA